MVSYPRRDEVWLIGLDPSKGSEIKKTRPCLVISPDEMNEALQTVLVAPMTTTLRSYPTRAESHIPKQSGGRLLWTNWWAIDRQRLVRRLGMVSSKTANQVSTVLIEMFVR